MEEAQEAIRAIEDLLDGCNVARSDLDAVILMTSLQTSDPDSLQILKLRALFIMAQRWSIATHSRSVAGGSHVGPFVEWTAAPS